MRPSQRLLGLILAPALLLIASPAHASSLYVTFSGTFDHTYAADQSVTAVTDYAGQSFTGSYVFTVDADASRTPAGLNPLDNKITSFTVALNGSPFSVPDGDLNNVSIFDNYGLIFGSDDVALDYGSLLGGPRADLLSNTGTHTLWSTTALPDLPTLNALTGWTFELILPNPTDPASLAHADDVTVSFSDTAPVAAAPVPAALFGALPLLALTALKGRTRRPL